MLQVMTEKIKSRAYLGFGGNIDDPVGHFRCARQKIAAHPEILVTASSPLYRTPPVGGPAGQPDFFNAVIALDTTLTEEQLLLFCQQLEHEAGRVRGIHWGPRPLDIDLLLYAEQVRHDPQLTLPHPRLHERLFVLLPLCDLAPQLMHPLLHLSLQQLLAQLPEDAGISRLTETW